MNFTQLHLNHPERTEKPVPLITTTVLISLAIAVLASFFFAWLAEEMLEGDTSRFDAAVRGWAHSLASPGLTKAMFAASWMGETGMILILIAALILFWLKKWKRAIGWMALTMIGALVLDLSLKYGFHRPRPTPFFGSLPSTYSFPSGHSLFSFCFYGVMAGLINARVRSLWLRVVVFITAALIIATIGFSRIYLGVHYPSDVVAGYLTGAIWVSTMVAMDRIRKTRRGVKIKTVSDPETE